LPEWPQEWAQTDLGREREREREKEKEKKKEKERAREKARIRRGMGLDRQTVLLGLQTSDKVCRLLPSRVRPKRRRRGRQT
jgi:hypothetical protein